MRMARLVFFAAVLAGLLLSSAAAYCADAPEAPSAGGLSKQAVKERMAEIQKEIDSIAGERDVLTEERVVEEDYVRRALEALGALMNAYSRYLTAIDRLEEAQGSAAAIPGGQDAESSSPVQARFNLSHYEDVLDRYETALYKLDSAASSIRLAEGSLSALKALEQRLAEQHLALLREPEPAEGPGRVARSLHLTEVEAELESAQVSRESQRIGIETQKIVQTSLHAERDALLKELAHVKEHLAFDEKDRDARLESIATRLAAARERLPVLRDERDGARLALSKRQGALTAARSDKERRAAQAAVAEQQAAVQLAQALLEQAEQAVQFLEEEQRIWAARYSLLEGGLKGQEIWDLRAGIQARQKNLENVFLVRQRGVASMQTEIAAARKELEENQDAGAVQARIRSRIDLLSRTAEAANASMAMIFPLFNQYDRLEGEINEHIDAVRIAERVTAFGKERFLAFWNITLWSGDGFDITVWKLSLAVALFLAAFFLSGRLTEFLSNTLLTRLGMDSMARMASRKILFFILMGAFILVALDLVGIPLTAFAFLGGALAIGIGFGAQNIFNNLISGFILMFSKPIRVDDMIEIDGMFASVEEIGTRATHIKTYENVDVLMPNSYFLNNKIVNWTLTDKKIRTTVAVGVAHDADVRRVEELLLLAANDHTRVLKNPEPFVVFREIGANSLDFTLYFWIDMENAVGFRVCSDIRFRMVSLLEKNGIRIASPRMDVMMGSGGIPAGDAPPQEVQS